MPTPSHLTRAQVARAMKLNYYNLTPLLRVALERGAIHPENHLGVMMIPAAEIPALKKLIKEVSRARK